MKGEVLVLGQVSDHHKEAAQCALGWVIDNSAKLCEKLDRELKVSKEEV